MSLNSKAEMSDPHLSKEIIFKNNPKILIHRLVQMFLSSNNFLNFQNMKFIMIYGFYAQL